MGYDREQIINLALDEVGYLEKKSNSQLDDKTANAGYNNYTKYARDLDCIGYFNGAKNGYPWCAVFVAWLFTKCFGMEEAQKLLCHPQKSYAAACEWGVKYFRDNGQFYTSNPQVGDQIFLGSSPDHTGIVYKVYNSKVYTVEGNTSGTSGVVSNGGGVCVKSYPLNASYIYGYGRPKYNDDYTEQNEETTTGGTCNVKLNVLSKGSKGNSVKSLQLILIGNGYSCGSYGADGDFGSSTLSAVKKFQKAKGLSVDGIVGSYTWDKLLK